MGFREPTFAGQSDKIWTKDMGNAPFLSGCPSMCPIYGWKKERLQSKSWKNSSLHKEVHTNGGKGYPLIFNNLWPRKEYACNMVSTISFKGLVQAKLFGY